MKQRQIYTLLILLLISLSSATVKTEWVKKDDIQPILTDQIIARFPYQDSLICQIRYSNRYPKVRSEGRVATLYFKELFDLANNTISTTQMEDLTFPLYYDESKMVDNTLLGVHTEDSIPLIIHFSDTITVEKIDTLTNYRGYTVKDYCKTEDRHIATLQKVEYPKTTILVTYDTQYNELWSNSNATHYEANKSGEVLFWKSDLREEIDHDSTYYNGGSYTNVAIIYGKLTPQGKIAWQQEIDDTLSDYANDAIALPSGNWLMTGYCKNISRPYGGYSDLFVTEIDRNSGEKVWQKSYESGRGRGNEIEALPDSTYIIIGQSNYGSAPVQNGSYSTAWLLKVNSVGDTLATLQYHKESYTTISSVMALANNSLIASYNNSIRWNLYDTNLVPQDSGTYTNLTTSIPYKAGTYLLASEGDGDKIISVGKSTLLGNGGEDIYIQVMDTLGNVLTTKLYGNTADQSATDIKRVGDNFIVTGVWDSTLWVAEINSNADTLWTKKYKRGTSGNSITVVDAGYLIAGEYFADSISDSVTEDSSFCMKIDFEGNKIWETALSQEGQQTPQKVVVLSQELSWEWNPNSNMYMKSYPVGTILMLERVDMKSTLHFLDNDGTPLLHYPFENKYYDIILNSDKMILSGSTPIGENISYHTFLVKGVVTAYNYHFEELWQRELGEEYSNKITKLIAQESGSLIFMGGYREHTPSKFSGPSKSDIWIGKLSSEGDLLWETHEDSTYTKLQDIVAFSDKSWISIGYHTYVGYRGAQRTYPGYYYLGSYNPIAMKFVEQEDIVAITSTPLITKESIYFSQGAITISQDIEQGEITLFSLSGRAVQKMAITPFNRSLNLQNLSAGCYIAQLRGINMTKSLRFIKR